MLIEEASENLSWPNAIATADVHEESAVWYAVYTRSRCEKKVNSGLRAHGIETCLPLYPVRRRWSDRSVELLVPLFPSYLFVNINPNSEEGFKVLDHKGVVKILSNGRKRIPVCEQEIASIKRILSAKVPVKSIPWLQEGKPIRVVAGPLAGIKGVIEGRGHKGRLCIAVESLGQTIVADIDTRDIRAL